MVQNGLSNSVWLSIADDIAKAHLRDVETEHLLREAGLVERRAVRQQIGHSLHQLGERLAAAGKRLERGEQACAECSELPAHHQLSRPHAA